MTNSNSALDEIDIYFSKYAVFVEMARKAKTADEAGKLTELAEKALIEAKQAIKKLITEAKAEELEYWQWKTDGHIEISGKQVTNRIKELRSK